jgi:small-conductance mechanosensitive channel
MNETKIRETFSEWINQITGIDTEFLIRIIDTLLIIFLLIIVSKIILRLVRSRTKNTILIYKWRKYTNYTATILGLILIGQIWIFEFASFATFLGLLSAGLVIALKDPITNFFGWIFIKWRSPFNVGDRIQIGDYSGDVIDIRLFTFQIMEIGNWVEADQTTGRTVNIPNQRIFISEIANFTSGFNFIWIEIPVVITFESNWKLAKELLVKIADEHTSHFVEQANKAIRRASYQLMLPEENVNPQIYTSVVDIGVQLSIRFICPPRERRSKNEEIWEHVLDEFAKCKDIDFAYPTIRYFDNKSEGKVKK